MKTEKRLSREELTKSYDLFKKSRKLKKCIVCNKEYMGLPNQKYCSKKCSIQQKRKETPTKQQLWFEKYKEKILELIKRQKGSLDEIKNGKLIEIIKNELGNKCCVCGTKVNLIIHHLNYDNPTLEDLILLCWTCHYFFHRQIKPYEKHKRKRGYPKGYFDNYF